MARSKSVNRGRKVKDAKRHIYLFFEGESEECYAMVLKRRYEDVAVINIKKKGLFTDADNRFKNDNKYKNAVDVIDEIWFFFDVEEYERDKWDERLKIIKKLRKLRKDKNITVRLLMTTGCAEYWFLLHYENTAPRIETAAEKENITDRLKKYVPEYEKGDQRCVNEISELYREAVSHGKSVIHNLLSDGLPGIEDSDERNQWLHTGSRTFTTVHEAIEYLESLQNKENK